MRENQDNQENEENQEKYKKIEMAKKIKKSFPKKAISYMSTFNNDKDLSNDNSNLKYNQISTIPKYGLLYFYNETGIYFLDNSKIKELFDDKKDLSLSNLFFLKCKNIYKIFSIEENDNAYLIICIQKDEKDENSNSFLIYINIENLIKKLSKENNIYNIKILEELEQKEKIFESGLFKREIEELDKNIELNEDGEYDIFENEKKKETKEEKKKKFKNEKEKILNERNDTFIKAYQNAKIYTPEKIIYIDNNLKDIIIIDKERYIILFENGDIIFYNNYEKNRIIQKNAILMSYNKETSIFLIISNDTIYILKERNDFNYLRPIKEYELKDILSEEEKEKIIFCENIYNYIILYTIENIDNPQNDDKLYFLEMNNEMNEINNIYFEGKYFYPDDYELDGIAFYSHLKRRVFSLFDKDLNIYMLFNKHRFRLDKYYTFIEKKENNNMYDLFFIDINEDIQLNSIIKINKKKEGDEDENEDEKEGEEEENEEEKEYKNKIENNNAFIGISLIKFKFDGYDNDKEFVQGQEVNTPYLLFTLGFYGGFKIFYAYTDEKLEEKTVYFDKTKIISNKVLEISINEEIIEKEKEKYIYENIKKQKNFTELNNLKQLNQRNIFLHELNQQIKDNLEYLENLAVPQTIKSELMKLQKIANNEKIQEIQVSMDNLMKEAKNLFEKEDENQLFIDETNELISNFKNAIIALKNDIKVIQDNKNKSKELKLNINTPINELLSHPKMKNFFDEETILNMKNIFDKIKNNYNLYENHVNLISEIFSINDNLIKHIEECKKKYGSIKDKYKYLDNRKDVLDIKTQLQNNIFLLYMRVFEQFFFNLEQFGNNNLNIEYLYLNHLKTNYLSNAEQSDNEEEKEENEDNIYNSNNHKKGRFMLREEEDIDEGNNINNSISSNHNESKLSSSYKNNKIIKFQNNSFNNIDNEENANISKNRINNINNFNDTSNYIVNKETNDIIKKIFGTNLVKEKEGLKKNYLIDILSNFEGRITYYNKQTEKDYCTDADDLFLEYLEDEDEIKQKNLEEKIKKEKKEKEKIKIIKNMEESIFNQKKEKENIEKELSKIDEINKKELLQKEKENINLRKKLEEFEKIFEENKIEREKEKNKFMEIMEKNKNEEKQKLQSEQNNNNLRIKSMEEEIKNYKKKFEEEEKKRIEFEEKIKKLEEEKNSNIQNISNNNNISNINNFSFSKNIQNENNKENVQNGKIEQKDKKEENKNQNNLFVSNNMFLPKNNENENENNQNNIKRQESIFDNLTNKDTNSQNQNLFKTITTSSLADKNIFKANNTDTNKNIFNLNNNKNTTSQNTNTNNLFSNITTTQNTNTNNTNNLFSTVTNNQATTTNNLFSATTTTNNQTTNNLFSTSINNQNKSNSIFGNATKNNDSSNSGGLFSNINIGISNQNNNNLLSFNQSSFGQHRQLGFAQNNVNNQTTNKTTFHFGESSSNTNTNNSSPFLSISNSGGLFNNQTQNNNNNNDNYFG